MKVIVFGATGMVGQGVLRECLLDPTVESVLSIGRRTTGQSHAKLRELVLADMSDLSSLRSEKDLGSFDACFFCLGVSSVGMNEESYRRITYDITLNVARTLLQRNADMTFIYVSGAGTDSTEKGRSMWARVKGKTENDLLSMPFKAAYMFRPGYIQPLHGIKSKTFWYRAAYAIQGPLYPMWKALFPKYVTTTEHIARAMIEASKHGAPKSILESADIDALGSGADGVAAALS